MKDQISKASLEIEGMKDQKPLARPQTAAEHKYKLLEDRVNKLTSSLWKVIFLLLYVWLILNAETAEESLCEAFEGQ